MPEPDLFALTDSISIIIRRIRRPQRPVMIAALERLAAARYRRWAAETDDPGRRDQLLACADREEEIARRVEAHYPQATTLQRRLVAQSPELTDLAATLFDGKTPVQQWALQAQGERFGAATWLAFAQRETRPDLRATFLVCAELEEASAMVLEEILAEEMP